MTYQRGNHAICNERYRYIRYANGDEELYDHADDPREWTNSVSRASLSAVKAGLARSLPSTDAPAVKDMSRPNSRRK